MNNSLSLINNKKQNRIIKNPSYKFQDGPKMKVAFFLLVGQISRHQPMVQFVAIHRSGGDFNADGMVARF